MEDTFIIKKEERSQCTLELPPMVAESLNIKGKKDCTVKFGTKDLLVTLQENQKIPRNNLVISSLCMKELSIPDFPQYQITMNNNELLIGPYIGILIAKSNRSLKRKKRRLNKYVEEYPLFSGAILAFSLEGVDPVNQVIYGLMYNPKIHRWVEGVYPYPGSVFRRISIPKRFKKHFQEQIGNNLFNSTYFSKWTMYQILKKNPKLVPHLPITKLYRRPSDLIQFLKKHKRAFLKPVHGLKGRNIKEFEERNDDYLVRFRKDGTNYIEYIPKEKIEPYLEMHLKPKQNLIQQKINIIFTEKKAVDFRLFVLKDQFGGWKCLGWVGREGIQGSVVSNRSSGGKIRGGDELLERILGRKKKDLAKLKEKVFSLAYQASIQMEQSDKNFGYFAIDMAIDTNHHIWIIEMNHRSPNDGLPLYVNNYRLFQEIKTHNMLYAKYLCGF
ncbi:YheC/YheD family protein [Bacillus dakarensis]|uniref:YheC/YheD family endospore coat-associated protein n=1 Tax=Robertmurraya dakarensis TaxID=1926278 RepID=UPI000980EDD3|nr:YheC/YheD family protein [Bacillus dakarensis]